MPDALSKTIPLWCCVLNRALFPDNPEIHNLYTPPTTISPSEHAQILSRIPEALAAFLRLNPDLPWLRAQLSKPLRPIWVSHETNVQMLALEEVGETNGRKSESPTIFTNFHPVICCTASRRVVDGEISGHVGYIQGAGDDTENWAYGLTPPIFWQHAEELLSTPEADLRVLIGRLLLAAEREATPRAPLAETTSALHRPAHFLPLPPTVRQLTPHLYVSPLPLPPLPPNDASWCTLALMPHPTPPETWRQGPTRMEIGLGKHKAASRNLRAALAAICRLVTPRLHYGELSADTTQRTKLLIACETGGRDLAVGVALALLCWCFEDECGAVLRRAVALGAQDDECRVAQPSLLFNKTMIKVRLARIMMAMPEANPNRATLQSVNSFLMGWK